MADFVALSGSSMSKDGGETWGCILAQRRHAELQKNEEKKTHSL